MIETLRRRFAQHQFQVALLGPLALGAVAAASPSRLEAQPPGVSAPQLATTPASAQVRLQAERTAAVQQMLQHLRASAVSSGSDVTALQTLVELDASTPRAGMTRGARQMQQERERAWTEIAVLIRQPTRWRTPADARAARLLEPTVEGHARSLELEPLARMR